MASLVISDGLSPINGIDGMPRPLLRTIVQRGWMDCPSLEGVVYVAAEHHGLDPFPGVRELPSGRLSRGGSLSIIQLSEMALNWPCRRLQIAVFDFYVVILFKK